MNKCFHPMRLSAVIGAFASAVKLAALEPEEIWERVSPSVVRVEAEMFDGERMLGSGFVCEMGGRKWIFSNRHVVLGAKKVRVGQAETLLTEASGYRISPELDLALIELPSALTASPLPIRSLELKTGERVFAVGFPLGLSKSINQGIISSQSDKVIQFDAAISSGNSGGPLVDRDGRVVAIVTAGIAPSANQVAQNLNFGIRATVVPKTELFRDPNLSFYDAWLELVRFERNLVDQINDLRFWDVYGCLMSEWFWLLASEQPPLQIQEKYHSELAKAVRNVVGRHGTVSNAAVVVSSFLKTSAKTFDRIPSMFLGVPEQPLMKEFAHDKRPGGLFRLEIEESEIVPLLKSSVDHAKAKYEDAAFRIDFLIRYLAVIKDKKSSQSKRFESLLVEWNAGKMRRESIRLDYSGCDISNFEASAKLFLLSSVSYSPPTKAKSTPTTLSLDEIEVLPIAEDELKSLQAADKSRRHIMRYGGFEAELVSMFERIAIERLQHGKVAEAIALYENEMAHRRQSDRRLMAHLHACAGNHETAYSLYFQAFTEVSHRFDAFSLTPDTGVRRLIFKEVVENADRFWSYPEVVKVNLRAWTAFLGSKLGDQMGHPPLSLADAMGSKQFQKLDELQRAIVINSFYEKALLDRDKSKLEEFERVLKSDTSAYAIYKELF